MTTKAVSGFSKWSKTEKINWLQENYLKNNEEAKKTLEQYWNTNAQLQQVHDDFIENTITNYYLPFGIAPNFLINNSMYAIPMVIEESSVVAAASNAAKFWLDRGGFKTKIISTQKNGQVHFIYEGDKNILFLFFEMIKPFLLDGIRKIEGNMKKRGGGLKTLSLIDRTQKLKNYYQLHATFETVDAMGANFINSCLEQIAQDFEAHAKQFGEFKSQKKYPKVVMSILSNYVPECIVKAWVSCPIKDLSLKDIDGQDFAEKFIAAVQIAQVETRRAVTHNKGIMNGVDAVILATGNDFRAIEAGVHAYAAKDGYYKSLTHAYVKEKTFYFEIEIPLALGTIGGLTSLHPLVKVALQILQNPSAKQLMEIVAVAGLAQNFAALKSLVTTGIQKGHMKMHLMNILNQLQVNDAEKRKALDYFKEKNITHQSVQQFIEDIRKLKKVE